MLKIMDLWSNLDKITIRLQNSPAKILMLDFDGTLAPIVKSPKEARLSSVMKELLIRLSKKQGFNLAVISGRSLDDLKQKVDVKNVIYAGSHGLEGEILHRRYSFPVSNRKLAILKIVQEQLKQIVAQFSGVFIENKGLVLSFHYRLAGKQIPKVRTIVKKYIRPYIQNRLISVLEGKMVFDIYPTVKWNKSSFAKLVIDRIHMKTKELPITIFIGDDATDEDIFRRLKKEITIKVGKSERSEAKYRLKNTDDVFKFLTWMNTEF